MSSYKVWLADQGSTIEDGFMYAAPWAGPEDAVQEFCEANYADMEYPERFEVTVCEVAPDGSRAGPDEVFDISVDYSPNFHAHKRAARSTPTGEGG